jgi:hypothetical protein
MDETNSQGNCKAAEGTRETPEDEYCIHGIRLKEFCEKCAELHTLTQNRDEW